MPTVPDLKGCGKILSEKRPESETPYRSGGRRGFQPPHKVDKISVSFSPGNALPANHNQNHKPGAPSIRGFLRMGGKPQTLVHLIVLAALIAIASLPAHAQANPSAPGLYRIAGKVLNSVTGEPSVAPSSPSSPNQTATQSPQPSPTTTATSLSRACPPPSTSSPPLVADSAPPFTMSTMSTRPPSSPALTGD